MKHIIITGASSGIGEATARAVAAAGHNVFLVARIAAKLKAVQTQLGENVEIMACDVADYTQVKQFIERAIDKFGLPDVLINNAGLGYFDTFENGAIEQWHEMVDVNVKGLLNCIHAALPHLVSSKGHIINIGSVGAHQVFANSGVYCATKHAVLAISESIRLEMADKVRVTTISPGSVNTPFIDSTTNAEMLKTYKDYFAKGMSPELVAAQILHAIECPPEAVISEIIIRPSRMVR